MLSTQLILQVSGLILDIIGVILLFFFGLPPDVNPKGQSFFLLEHQNEKEKIKGIFYISISWLAFCFLILGFLLQIFATIYNIIPSLSDMKPK